MTESPGHCVMWKHLFFIAALAVGTSCGVSRKADSRSNDALKRWRLRQSELSTTFYFRDQRVSDKECRGVGGEIRQVCMGGVLSCVIPYLDAGAPCRDGADCEGKCLYEGSEVEIGAEVVGACEKDDDPCGCFTEVANGRTTESYCAD